MGSLVIFSGPLLLISKKSSNHLKREHIDRHNNALENQNPEPSVSMYLGIGLKSVNRHYAPAVFWSMKF